MPEKEGEGGLLQRDGSGCGGGSVIKKCVGGN